MPQSVTLDGITFDDTDFDGADGYGYLEEITVGGESYRRFLGIFAAWLRDAGKARIATSATSKSMGSSGSQAWVLDSDVPFAPGAFVVIARVAAPTTTYYIAQVTSYDSGSRTLTVTIESSFGSSGPYTDWSITVIGKTGAGLGNFAAGNFSRDISLSSGTQAVTGLGFQPRSVFFFSGVDSSTKASWGFHAGGVNRAVFSNSGGSAGNFISSNIVIGMQTGASDAASAVVSSLDSDGFTLTWTKQNSPTGTAVINYIAMR